MLWRKKKVAESPPEPTFDKPKKKKVKELPEREPVLMVAPGTKGAGKTVQTLKEMEAYVKIHNRPVVIFDVNLETDYAKYKSISIKDLPRLQLPEIRRVVPFHIDRTPFSLKEKAAALGQILEVFEKGCVVIEDMNNYLTSTRIQTILSSITTNRHRAQDIIIHVQNIGKLDPTLWENANLIRYHEQNEFSPSVRGRLPHKEILTITDILLRTALEKKPYAFIYIGILKYAIYNTTESEFREAARIYLNRNRSKFNQLCYELDLKPKQEGSKEAALNLFVKERKRWLIDDKK